MLPKPYPLRRHRLAHVLCQGMLLSSIISFDASAHSASQYSIDQRFGSVGFSVSHLGLFTSQGRFDQFRGMLTIDPEKPETARLSVIIDTNSIDTASQDTTAMLRSAEFFDTAHYPRITYRSTTVVPLKSGDYMVNGMIEMRGVTRPQAFEAHLLARRTDPVTHRDSADFAVVGTLLRSEFGMVADRLFISDKVTLVIHVRIELADTPNG